MKKGLKEGSPEHAALHAIVGCAGAAASNQGCSSGALGGAASSVLAGLFAEADANETAVEREAKRNLITSLVTGIAAVSDPNGAATANNAATANIDNNWLSTQQFVQAKKELEEAQGTLAKAIVTAKWFGTSVRQDALTAGGIGLGIAESGLQDIRGLAEFLSDPLTGLQGIASVVSSSELRAQLGEEVTASLLGSIDRMKLALEVGGDDHAVQLGRDLGALIYTVGGVLTAVGGAAKAGLSLAKTGVEVSSKALGKMVAKDSEELGVRVAALETRTTKSLDVVTDGKGAGAKGPETGLPSGETKVVGGSPSTDVPKASSEQVAQNSKGTDLPDKKPETNPQNHPEEPKKDKGPCCFAAGTMVATPAGDRAIETLKIGDIVWTKPEHGGEPFASTVVKTFQRNDQPIYKLTLESTRTSGDVKQEILFVTPSHPFYVPARRDFVPMIELRAGDLLQSLTDGATENTSSRVAGVELFKPVGQTYNLTVDVGHTFYVGELKTWVHNEGDCDPNSAPQKQGDSADDNSTGSKATGGAAGKVDEFIPPGMDRPFRPVNPEFPPNKSVVEAMESPQIKSMVRCSGADCSDIASKLFDASGGKGAIIEVRPVKAGDLNVYENGIKEPGQFYHQVYTDGRYVYDPRLSSNPIPKGDWEQHIKNINPNGVSISDKLKGLK